MRGIDSLGIDKHRGAVDMIAMSLGLQLVGHLFTRTASEEGGALLESHEIRRMAKMQQQYLVDHPLNFKVSKFVTVVLSPRGNDVSDIET